jgi:hypothetical protein
MMVTGCGKFQITNSKYQTNPKKQIQNSKPLKKRLLVIEYWNLEFICYLEFVIWDFIRPGAHRAKY